MDRIVTTADLECTICDRQRIVGIDRIDLGIDVEVAACDHHIVLADDRMICVCIDGKRTASIDRQVVFGKDHGIDIVLIDGDVLSSIGEDVVSF